MLPVIKWSGSKRSQAGTIASLFPEFETYFEPFLGGGSVLIQSRPKRAICGDVCEPLIEFWNMIKDNPMKMIKDYTKYGRCYKMRDIQHIIKFEIDLTQTQIPQICCFFHVRV